MPFKWTWTEQTHDVSPDNEHEVEILVTAEDGETVIQSSASFWIKPFGLGGATWNVAKVGGELLPSESRRSLFSPCDHQWGS